MSHRITTKGETMVCYLQINRGDWCQETYETASRDAGRRTRQLKKAGYVAKSSAMGPQVTPIGVVELTTVHILPGTHADTFDLPSDGWSYVRMR